MDNDRPRREEAHPISYASALQNAALIRALLDAEGLAPTPPDGWLQNYIDEIVAVTGTREVGLAEYRSRSSEQDLTLLALYYYVETWLAEMTEPVTGGQDLAHIKALWGEIHERTGGAPLSQDHEYEFWQRYRVIRPLIGTKGTTDVWRRPKEGARLPNYVRLVLRFPLDGPYPETIAGESPHLSGDPIQTRLMPWVPGEKLTILSDPQTQFFMRMAWTAQNAALHNDRSILKLTPEGMPYYRGDGGEELYMASSLINGPVYLSPEQSEAYTQRILNLNDDHVIQFTAAIAKWFSDRGMEKDSKGNPAIIKTNIHVNDMLRFAGVAPDSGGGYSREKKMNCARVMWDLSEVIIRVPRTTYSKKGVKQQQVVHSRLLEVAQINQVDMSGEEHPYLFAIAPGEYALPYVAADGKMMAVLLQQILPQGKRQGKSKTMALRIGFYLSMQWRMRAAQGNYAQPWYVDTILKGACIPIEEDSRLRDRFVRYFDDAIDSLAERGCLGRWEYLDWDPGERKHRSWFEAWLQARVVIEPPDIVLNHYAAIPRAAQRAIAAERKREGSAAKKGRAQDQHPR